MDHYGEEDDEREIRRGGRGGGSAESDAVRRSMNAEAESGRQGSALGGWDRSRGGS